MMIGIKIDLILKKHYDPNLNLSTNLILKGKQSPWCILNPQSCSITREFLMKSLRVISNHDPPHELDRFLQIDLFLIKLGKLPHKTNSNSKVQTFAICRNIWCHLDQLIWFSLKLS